MALVRLLHIAAQEVKLDCFAALAMTIQILRGKL